VAPLQRQIGELRELDYIIQLSNASVQCRDDRLRERRRDGADPRWLHADAGVVENHGELRKAAQISRKHVPAPRQRGEDRHGMPLRGREQRLEFAAFECVDFTRVDDRHDPQAQCTGLRSHLGHQSLELRVAMVHAPQGHEAVWIQRNRAFRERKLHPDGSVGKDLGSRGSHVCVEPPALRDQDPVDPHGVHHHDTRCHSGIQVHRLPIG
jgi:hypothetical protein